MGVGGGEARGRTKGLEGWGWCGGTGPYKHRCIGGFMYKRPPWRGLNVHTSINIIVPTGSRSIGPRISYFSSLSTSSWGRR